MKKYLILSFLVLVVVATVVTALSVSSYYRNVDTEEIYLLLAKMGIMETPSSMQTVSLDAAINPAEQVSLALLPQTGFPVIDYRNEDFSTKDVDLIQLIYRDTDFSSIKVDADMTQRNDVTELPLFQSDYYFRKYENGKAGAMGINKIPILHPGDSIGVVKDRYIDINPKNGFVQPPGYYFGSGVCWSTSALGALQDNANASFKAKYGYDLFVFGRGDRAPHGEYYQTYTNNHHGYTILQLHPGVPAQDYRFTVNPALKDVPELKDLKIKIVMIYTDNHPTASHGQSIGGYLLSNLQF